MSLAPCPEGTQKVLWQRQLVVKNYIYIHAYFFLNANKFLVILPIVMRLLFENMDTNYDTIRSSNLILEGQCPAEFSSTLPQHTCLEV